MKFNLLVEFEVSADMHKVLSDASEKKLLADFGPVNIVLSGYFKNHLKISGMRKVGNDGTTTLNRPDQ